MRRFLFKASAILLLSVAHCFAQTMTQGLRATFDSNDGKSSDTRTTPTLALYVPEGQSPTSFLPGGKFHVVWSGFLRSDLRDELGFQVEVKGTFKLEVGNVTVLEASDTKGVTPFSEPVSLKKGLNVLRATFSSPVSGDAFVRVNVKTSDGLVQPLDRTRLSCAKSSDLVRDDAMRDGFALFLEHRCVRCHDAGVPAGAPDLNMDAPALDGIGSRLREEWVARWVADPRSVRGDAHMPQIKVASRAENARAIAAFLASTGTNSAATTDVRLTSEEIRKGQELFEGLHCEVCHYTEGVGTPDSAKVSLSNVGAKFYPDALRAYIEKPDAFYKWTAMPRFRLAPADADLLARWLISRSLAFAPAGKPATREVIEHGKELVQTLGCLNCHTLNLPNRFSTIPLARVGGTRGCIGSDPQIDFGFTSIERSAIDLWLSNERAAMTRNVPVDFTERYYTRLHCAECHRKVDGLPPLDNLGEKLKPEWMAQFIAGNIAQKPRPWLMAQMPAFPQYATNMAQGLAEESGFGPHSLTNLPVADLAKIGSELVQPPPQGLGCVQCHANGATAPATSDSPGINFALVGARLQPSYFQRWVRKPSVIDPQTKMPAFFNDEGKSPLTQYFEGDAEKQIAAIWEYLQSRHE